MGSNLGTLPSESRLYRFYSDSKCNFVLYMSYKIAKSNECLVINIYNMKYRICNFNIYLYWNILTQNI